jgi:hypothetical protein
MESFQKYLLSKEGKDKKEKIDKMGKFCLFSPICHCCSPLQIYRTQKNQRCKPPTKQWLVRFVGFQNLPHRVRVWVSGFQKPNSGFGFGFRVRKYKKTGFWVQVLVGFCKKHRNSSKISLEKLFFLYC